MPLRFPGPTFPPVQAAELLYARWEEENYPRQAVRCGIPAPLDQQIWGSVMPTTDPSLRDAAACVFAYCFHGMRDSSVMSIVAENFEIGEEYSTARISFLKGRAASQGALVCYARWSALPSPIDLFVR